MLTLEPAEQQWLNKYRDALKREYPGVVRRMIVYGSKARGDAHQESDIDIVIIVRNDSPHLDRPVRLLGHDLATLTPAIPSMSVYTETARKNGLETGFTFQQNVEHEGVDVF